MIDGSLSIGKLLIFLAYLNTLQNQAWSLARTYTSLQSRRAEIDRVTEYLATPDDIIESKSAVSMPQIRGEVSIENVNFGYDRSSPVFARHHAEHSRRPDDRAGRADRRGEDDVGVARAEIFDPWEGCVRIDGIDVREMRLRELRQNISLVLQESFLFSISIAENIAFGKPNASRSEIECAAEAANAVEFIEQLPDRYDTIIGERGATLSGGQKQRLSIARRF